eukprot:scaffold13918_cov122-Isochrysis_galbana.AAC.1
MECYPNRFGTIRHYLPPKIPPILRDRWESLQVTVVHNTFSDREGKRHYTKDENRSYIDTELDYHYFQNKKINNERFLASWDTITQHCDTNIIPFQSSKQKKPTPPARGARVRYVVGLAARRLALLSLSKNCAVVAFFGLHPWEGVA